MENPKTIKYTLKKNKIKEQASKSKRDLRKEKKLKNIYINRKIKIKEKKLIISNTL